MSRTCHMIIFFIWKTYAGIYILSFEGVLTSIWRLTDGPNCFRKVHLNLEAENQHHESIESGCQQTDPSFEGLLRFYNPQRSMSFWYKNVHVFVLCIADYISFSKIKNKQNETLVLVFGFWYISLFNKR